MFSKDRTSSFPTNVNSTSDIQKKTWILPGQGCPGRGLSQRSHWRSSTKGSWGPCSPLWASQLCTPLEALIPTAVRQHAARQNLS